MGSTDKKKFLLAAMYLSIAGILFAGYMTLSKIITKTCSFGEACPYLWGYPACVYGLIIFVALFLSILTLVWNPRDRLAGCMFPSISILGVIYAGYFAYLDIFRPACGEYCTYQLGLPTCVYGFMVFLAVAVCMIIYTTYTEK